MIKDMFSKCVKTLKSKFSRSNKRMTGITKFFNAAKGFGFITLDDGSGDAFVHFSAIQSDGYKSLNEGQKVELDLEETPKGKKAVNVRIIG